ncbi:DHA2 family multidrug resistance protein-like MFS transporter [Actinoalloteichus hoggarensis]|uniref:Antiseptic resistance protein n=1 Tax=Actinoalloteichus hoggarensis TaxID=1470176 RepID=A0A221W7I6_9PSEU|nr:MFS transporter [Actinoalloteichus hoggarensis]ASO21671.1 Antiseptic resistance protein [Actinoalloteichus hoggarensis]MBB5922265.1 DHA2 family multidrug resistance protein-like MFS transporter [Actinoalloteichus hoggarensis]
MTVNEVPAKAGRREWAGLAVLSLPTLIITFDMFVLLLALPGLSADLQVGTNAQLWIVDIYGFMVGGFLVTMGTLGDRIGRRRLLMIGAAAFAVASFLAAYATTAEMLIAARALLGIAGATLAPSTLALISNMFRDQRQMAFAIGVWAGCFTLGAILGPFVGGLVLEHFWWGSVFLLAVPVMVLLLILGPLLLPEFRSPVTSRIDLVSVGLSLAAVLMFIYGLKEAARDGLGVVSVLVGLIGIGLGVLFVRRQRTLTDPLLDLKLFGNRSFSTMLVGPLFYSMIGGTTMVFLTQHFQSVADLSPLQAALCLLPGMVVGTFSSMVSPVLARYVRPAYLIGYGLFGVVATFVWFTQVDADAGLAVLVIGFAVMSLCDGPLIALGTGLVVGSAPPERAGSASSMAQTSNEMGAALGVATLGTLGTAVYYRDFLDNVPAGVPADSVAAAGENIAGAVVAAGELSEPTATELLQPAREAFTFGLNVFAGVSAAILAAIAVLVLVRLKDVPPLGKEEEQQEPGENVADDVTS